MSGSDIVACFAGGAVAGFTLCLTLQVSLHRLVERLLRRHIALPLRWQNAVRGPVRLVDDDGSGPRRGDIDASTEGEELGRKAPPREPKGGAQ